MAVIPEPVEQPAASGDDSYREPLSVVPSGASNAPVVEVEPEPEPDAPRNLDEIREELKRRNED